MAENSRWLEAVEILDAASRAGDDTAFLHEIRGRCLRELGWAEDAAQEYERAIQLDHSRFYAYINLTTIYRSTGKRKEALNTLQQAEKVLQTPQLTVAPRRYARPAAPMLEELAEAYARLGEFSKSVGWALQAQTADPTRMRGYMLAAKSYFVLKQADNAIPLLQKACSVAPNDPDAHYTLALALRVRPSPPHDQAAREHLITTIRLEPQHAPALYQLGLICMERKEWDHALSAFRGAYDLQYEPGTLLWKAAEASTAKKDLLETAFFLGQYYEYVGQLDTALRYFQTLAATPKYKRIGYGFIARAQAKMDHYAEAVATLTKLMSIDPDSPDLRRQLAAVYDRMHVVTKRVAALQDAARLDGPNAHRDYYLLGKIAMGVGDYDRAEEHLEKAIELAPKVSQYHYSLGQTLLLRPEIGDRMNKAIRHLEEAGRLSPDSVNIHDFLSSAYVKAQRWQDAAVALHRSADLAGQNQVLYFRLNQVYKRMGNEREAKRAQDYYQRLRRQEVEQDLLTRQVKAHPNDPGSRFALGDFFLRVRDYAGAKRQFEKAIDLKRNDAALHDRLATVYGELAQPEAQLTHLRQMRRATTPGRLAEKP